MKKSFPDYDNAPLFRWLQARLAPLGAYDSSWHNDMAPSLSIDLPDGRLSLIVDYKDSKSREVETWTLVVYHDKIGDEGTESPRHALRLFLRIAFPHLNSFQRYAIERLAGATPCGNWIMYRGETIMTTEGVRNAL